MFSIKKGHRPPPNWHHGKTGGTGQHGPEHKPNGPGGPGPNPEMAAFLATESGEFPARSKELKHRFSEDMEPELMQFWHELGVKKEVFDTEWEDGRFRYNVHTPLNIDAGKRYPLIYYSHGGMGTPLEAEFIGYSMFIAEKEYIVVYANNGGYSNECADTEFPRIMEEIRKKGYPVDWSRVYAVGFSSGSDATETIATLWPEYVAAVAPCPGSNAMFNSLCRITEEAYEKCLPLQVPVVFAGGTNDNGDAYPFPDQECFDNFNIWLEKIAKVKDFRPIALSQSRELIASTDDMSKKVVGVDFQNTWTEYAEGRVWYFGEYFDMDERPVVRFVVGEGVPHMTTKFEIECVLDYLFCWSRDPKTKELTYTV